MQREFGLVDRNEQGIGRHWTCDCRLLAGGLRGPLPLPATPWVRPPPAVLDRFVSRPVSPIPAHSTLVPRPALDGRREGLGQDGDSRGDSRPDRHANPATEHIADGSRDQDCKHGVDHGRRPAPGLSPVRTAATRGDEGVVSPRLRASTSRRTVSAIEDREGRVGLGGHRVRLAEVVPTVSAAGWSKSPVTSTTGQESGVSEGSGAIVMSTSGAQAMRRRSRARGCRGRPGRRIDRGQPPIHSGSVPAIDRGSTPLGRLQLQVEP